MYQYSDILYRVRPHYGNMFRPFTVETCCHNVTINHWPEDDRLRSKHVAIM